MWCLFIYYLCFRVQNSTCWNVVDRPADSWWNDKIFLVHAIAIQTHWYWLTYILIAFRIRKIFRGLGNGKVHQKKNQLKKLEKKTMQKSNIYDSILLALQFIAFNFRIALHVAIGRLSNRFRSCCQLHRMPELVWTSKWCKNMSNNIVCQSTYSVPYSCIAIDLFVSYPRLSSMIAGTHRRNEWRALQIRLHNSRACSFVRSTTHRIFVYWKLCSSVLECVQFNRFTLYELTRMCVLALKRKPIKIRFNLPVHFVSCLIPSATHFCHLMDVWGAATIAAAAVAVAAIESVICQLIT